MLERTVATPYIRRGASALHRSELIYLLSGEYGWYGPREAEDVVEHAVDAGALEKKDDGELTPAFQHTGVEALEDGDVPSADTIFDSGFEGHVEEDVFERAVAQLQRDGLERREAVAEINQQHRRLGDVDVEAAAALAVKRRTGDDDLVKDAIEQLKRS